MLSLPFIIIGLTLHVKVLSTSVCCMLHAGAGVVSEGDCSCPSDATTTAPVLANTTATGRPMHLYSPLNSNTAQHIHPRTLCSLLETLIKSH